jgi:predicted nucleic acid-binding Zn ribbon protein
MENITNKVEDTVNQNQRMFAAGARSESVEEKIEKIEEKAEKEEKRLTVSMMVIFAMLIVIATLFVLSYMNGARVIGN